MYYVYWRTKKLPYKFYWSVFAVDHSAAPTTFCDNQIIPLTTNHATPIIISPIAADFIIENHLLYASSSHADVSIRKPPYKRIINAISAKIPNTQLATLLITSSKLSCWSWSTPHTFTWSSALTASVPFLWYQKEKSKAVTVLKAQNARRNAKPKSNCFMSKKKNRTLQLYAVYLEKQKNPDKVGVYISDEKSLYIHIMYLYLLHPDFP